MKTARYTAGSIFEKLATDLLFTRPAGNQGIATPPFGFCVFTTCIAVAIKPLISPRLAGTIIELFVFANCANAPTYCSATFRLTASSPPGSRMAAPTWRSASALACASATMAVAWPSARLIDACFSPSERAMAASRSPLAILICSCLRPSEAAISARFSR